MSYRAIVILLQLFGLAATVSADLTADEIALAEVCWKARSDQYARIRSGDVTVVVHHVGPTDSTPAPAGGGFSFAPPGEERHHAMWCDEIAHYWVRTENLPSRLRYMVQERDLHPIEAIFVSTPERCDQYQNNALGSALARADLSAGQPVGQDRVGSIDDARANCVGGNKGHYWWRRLAGGQGRPTPETLESYLDGILSVWRDDAGRVHIYRERKLEEDRVRQMLEVLDPQFGYMPVWAYSKIAGEDTTWAIYHGYHQVEGIWIAKRLDTVNKARWSDEWVTHSVVLESAQFNRPEFCDPARYHIHYPAGITVYDNRNNLRYIMHTPGTATDEAIDEAVQRNPGRRIVHMGLTGDALAAAQAEADRVAAEQAADLARRRAERDRERASAQPTATASPFDGRLGIIIAAGIAAALAIACWAVARWMLKRNPSA
jgi:hypothetical protein